jgi:guanylate kinase
MNITPPALARRQRSRASASQNGVILSFTIVRHPPAGFPAVPHTIGLIELEDGSRVCANIIGTPIIGAHVSPRMRRTTVTPEQLRVYDIAYEVVAAKPASIVGEKFQGYILALTGPSGVGKTTVSRMLSKVCSEYVEQVPIVTTRSKKNDDDGEYRYVTKEEFGGLLAAQAMAAFTHIPSNEEERWYGYRKSDIEKIWAQGKLPVVITEMHLLQKLSNFYGRRSILSLGLLPPGRSKRAMLSALLHRLRERGRDTEEHIRDRVKNAAVDLDFFRRRSDLFDKIVVNDDLQNVINIVRGHVPHVSPQAQQTT